MSQRHRRWGSNHIFTAQRKRAMCLLTYWEPLHKGKDSPSFFPVTHAGVFIFILSFCSEGPGRKKIVQLSAFSAALHKLKKIIMLLKRFFPHSILSQRRIQTGVGWRLVYTVVRFHGHKCFAIKVNS